MFEVPDPLVCLRPPQTCFNMTIAYTIFDYLSVCLFVCLLQDASGRSNVLKAGKTQELKNARKRRTARKAN